MNDTITFTRRGAAGLALGGLFATTARAAPAADGFAAIDAAAATLVDGRISPGVAVSIMKAGVLVYSKGFGAANLETATPVTPQSIFKVGSITKQFTAAALVQLQEEGKLSVDDKLSRFLPDFPRAGEITLGQMLSHTSGLGNYTNVSPREAFMQEARIDYDSKALYQAMLKTSPMYVFEPGTGWAYSNTAFVLLGLVVEKVAGEPYGVYFKRRLFTPAGLIDTAVDDMAEVVPRRVSGYSGHPGSDTQFDNASYISMTFPGAAGSIRSTSEDLCRWHTALFAGKIVRPESLKAMTTPKRLSGGGQTMSEGPDGKKKPVNYGYGLFIETVEGRLDIGHGGGINGFVSSIDTFPAEKLSVATLVNVDGLGRPKMGPAQAALKAAAAKAALGLV